MIHIIGDGLIPEAKCMYDVRDALEFDDDIYLLPHVAPFVGETIPNGSVIYNVEPLYDGCRSLSVGYMDTLKRCRVLDYSATNVRYLKMHGIEAFHMPYGYHESLERPVSCEKNIDILCVGSVNKRRMDLFKEVRSDVNFQWVQGVYGADLDGLIARAKVLVNVHFCESHPLEVVRLNYLMANHCTVVTEHGNDDEVNSDYATGVIFSRYADLLKNAYHAMKNPVDGYECIKNMPHDCAQAQEWLRNKND